MRRVHVLGDLNLDLILSGLEGLPALGGEILAREHEFKAGGSGANTAMVLALLGAPARLFACVGRDLAGALVLAELRRSGLPAGTIRRLRGQATAVTVSLSHPQERMYLTSSGSVAGASLEQFKAGYLRPGAHLHLSSFFLQRGLRGSVARLLERAKVLGMTTSLDPGHDPEGRWDFRELEPALSALDWFLPSQDELHALAGNAAGGSTCEPTRSLEQVAACFQAARARGFGSGRPRGAGDFGIVVKAGSQGCWLWQGGTVRAFPAVACEAVDPTCAGDCFDAGFLFALAQGRPVEEAATAGNRLGALGASCLGLPGREVLGREARVLNRAAKGGVT